MNLADLNVHVHTIIVLSLKWKRGAYWNDSAYSIEAFVRIGVLIETRVLN